MMAERQVARDDPPARMRRDYHLTGERNVVEPPQEFCSALRRIGTDPRPERIEERPDVASGLVECWGEIGPNAHLVPGTLQERRGIMAGPGAMPALHEVFQSLQVSRPQQQLEKISRSDEITAKPAGRGASPSTPGDRKDLGDEHLSALSLC
jgi:hypothetical protein